MPTKPWTKFSVGEPSRIQGQVNRDCQLLDEVAHVAHVPTAVRIAEDRRLRADLVFDQSKLRRNRIRVVWLSPNHWVDGYRYGNVRFGYEWKTLVQDRRAYWVESIDYSPEACRILLTGRDYGSALDAYDPSIGDGPWWVDPKGCHYWNGNYCLELMVEDDLELTKCKSVGFVDHHATYCNENHATCRYKNRIAPRAGAEFLARLAGSLTQIDLPGLTRRDNDRVLATYEVSGAVSQLVHRLARLSGDAHGTVRSTDECAAPLARALLRTLADDALRDDRVALAGQFRTLDDATAAVMSVLAISLGLSDTAALDLE